MKFLALLSACALTWAADTVVFQTGGKIEGTVIQQDEKSVVLKSGMGTLTLQKAGIARIDHTDDAPATKPITVLGALDDRLPGWDTVVTALAAQPWASRLRQIPATVIDVGVMRSVPYTSYRCGAIGSIEVNVYGDPDSPICLELGIYGPRSSDAALQSQLVEFAASKLLRNPLNQAITRGLARTQDTATHQDLTMEITPPSAPDAYGAWWLAVYYLDKVEKARATPAEIESISVARNAVKTPAAEGSAEWGADDVRLARAAPAADPTPTTGSTGAYTSGGSSGGGGRVYVRGYTRKDGTYVQPHSRKR